MKLTELARNEYLVADGDLEAAIKALLKLAKGDGALTEKLLYQGASSLINSAHAMYRSEVIVDSATENIEAKGDTVSLYAKQSDDRDKGNAKANSRAQSIGMIVQRTLMDLTFKCNGVTFKLKDADKNLLTETSAWYINYGNNLTRRGKWLERIANGLEGEETVKEKYSEDTLKELLDD